MLIRIPTSFNQGENSSLFVIVVELDNFDENILQDSTPIMMKIENNKILAIGYERQHLYGTCNTFV